MRVVERCAYKLNASDCDAGRGHETAHQMRCQSVDIMEVGIKRLVERQAREEGKPPTAFAFSLHPSRIRGTCMVYMTELATHVLVVATAGGGSDCTST